MSNMVNMGNIYLIMTQADNYYRDVLKDRFDIKDKADVEIFNGLVRVVSSVHYNCQRCYYNE